MTIKLVVVVSHPIQHFAPFYRALGAHSDVDLVVLFASRIGLDPYFDKDMNAVISWKMDLLGGYVHVFLPESERIASAGPFKVNNPSVSLELDRQRPDAVLIYGYSQLTSLRALWWCRRRGVPALMISDTELRAHRSLVTRVIKRTVVPTILRQFRCFLTVGDANEECYRHYGIPRERFFRSPFTIDEEAYMNARTRRVGLRARMRRQLGVSDNAVVALTVGKLTTRKRAMDVLDAARILRAAIPPTNIVFVLAGNGPLLAELQSRVESEGLPVILAGFVNVDELPAMYAAADTIVHPSARDPHPLVMSEAACIGLPLIISDRVGAAGPTDIARPGKNAIVFPCGDVVALVNAVRRLAVDEGLRARMSHASVEIFDALNMQRSVRGALEALAFCRGEPTTPGGSPT